MITAYFDGGITKNPGGEMDWSFAIESAFKYKKTYTECAIPNHTFPKTNNTAEYLGLIFLLEHLINENVQKENLHIIGDSQIVINSMTKTRKKTGINSSHAHIKFLSNKAKSLLSNFSDCILEWKPRQFNKADKSFADDDTIANKINEYERQSLNWIV